MELTRLTDELMEDVYKQLDISRCRQTINGLSMYAAAYPWSFEVNGHSKMAPKRVPENLDL